MPKGKRKGYALLPYAGKGRGSNPASVANLRPHQVGEPAWNKKEPPPGAMDEVRKLAALGWTVDSIGKVACNMNTRCWAHWRKAHPEWEAAVQEGRDQLHDKMVNTLTHAATEGNVVPAMFLLKTRFGYRENDVPQQERPAIININLPAAAKLDAYLERVQPAALIDATATADADADAGDD